jgi:hypothetical protein
LILLGGLGVVSAFSELTERSGLPLKSCIHSWLWMLSMKDEQKIKETFWFKKNLFWARSL